VAKLRGVHRTPSGTMLVDQEHRRLIEFGVRSGGTLTSAPLSLGMPGVRKTIDSLSVIAETPPGTSVSIAYSLDDGPWKGDGPSVTLPSDATATSIRYRLTLNTADAALTPIVREVRVGFDVASSGAPPTRTPAPAGKKTPARKKLSTKATDHATSGGRRPRPPGSNGASTGSSATGSTGASSGTASAGAQTGASKGGGAVAALPTGVGVELQGLQEIHSGFVMEQMSGSGLGGANTALNRGALAVDSAGVATAGMLLGTCYVMGLAQPQFARGLSGAWGMLRRLVLRSAQA